ncbi:MAG: GNAT family N-acetyltransferase [Planctomycetota bacterium]
MLIDIRPIKPEQTHAMRHAVLRPHQPIEAMVYPGDNELDTFHLAAVDGQGRVVGIVSFYEQPSPLGSRQGDWQLRGMAVEPALQGKGLGARLVQAGIDKVREQGGQRLWCNARVTAQRFYEKLGFISEGEEFHIEHIGPHYVMATDIAV